MVGITQHLMIWLQRSYADQRLYRPVGEYPQGRAVGEAALLYLRASSVPLLRDALRAEMEVDNG